MHVHPEHPPQWSDTVLAMLVLFVLLLGPLLVWGLHADGTDRSAVEGMAAAREPADATDSVALPWVLGCTALVSLAAAVLLVRAMREVPRCGAGAVRGRHGMRLVR